jgi:hypothetical protein
MQKVKQLLNLLMVMNFDEPSGAKEIKQDLDKIEPIFEKFNPEQIDNWRKIWKT